MERCIAHVSVPNFPVEMEALRFPRLRRWPFVLVPSAGSRAVIRAVSEEAERAGIHKGMLLSAAKRVCRDLEALPFDERYYAGAGEEIFRIVRAMSELAEPVLFGKVFVDLSFVHRRAAALCQNIIAEIRNKVSIDPVVGIASNKLVSGIATRVIPEYGIHHVKAGTEKEFLRPHRAKVLPAVDRTIWRELERMGLERIGTIAPFPAADLMVVFGRAGALLHEQANGIDYTPVLPPRRAKEKVFGQVLVPDTNDIDIVRGRVFCLVETACSELRAEHVRALRISLEIEYADTRTAGARIKLRYPSAENDELKRAASELVARIFRRRVGVRVVIFSILELAPESEQLELFAAPLEVKQRTLNATLDVIRAKFGQGTIGYARSL